MTGVFSGLPARAEWTWLPESKNMNFTKQWYADLYGGGALSERTTVDVSQQSPTAASASLPLDIGGSSVFGARFGGWAGFAGLAADVSYFKRSASNGTFDVIPISALLLFRVPLIVSQDYPNGRLQPYGGGGISFVVVNASIPSPAPGIEAANELRGALGFNVLGGVAWHFTKHLGLFSEYRVTSVNFEFKHRQCFQASCPWPGDATVTGETKVSLVTQQVLLGLRITF
jgi:opacity protein-like surface antigen